MIDPCPCGNEDVYDNDLCFKCYSYGVEEVLPIEPNMFKSLFDTIENIHYAQVTSTIDRCHECKQPYPCKTIRALNGTE